MPRLARHCLACGTLTKHGPRCKPCDDANHTAAYGGQWPAVSRAQRKTTPWCQCTGQCRRHTGLCAATTDLTADHITPHSQGGTASDGTRTMCRTCNAARGDRT